jgi:hypothetical protein
VRGAPGPGVQYVHAASLAPARTRPRPLPNTHPPPPRPPGDPAGTPLIEWELAYAEALRDAGRAGEAAGQLRAALGHLAAAKGAAAAQASEVAERLVDALEAAGQLPAAREAMQACVEARMQLFGRHLVVAKSMTRMTRLLLAAGAGGGPDAAQLAQNFAASAVALAEEAAAGKGSGGGGGAAGGGGGGLRGFVGRVFGGGGGGGGGAAERLAERLRAQLELGLALQALAAANEAAAGVSARGAGEPALRQAADALRRAGSEGAAELAGIEEQPGNAAQVRPRVVGGGGPTRLAGLGAAPTADALLRDLNPADPLPSHPATQAAALDKALGLLVDIKLAQIEVLEALAATVSRGGRGAAGVGGAAEAKGLLAEAEAVAQQLSA